MQQLREDIVSTKYCRNSLGEYRHVFNELLYVNGIILRGNKIVIQKNFQADVIGIAHENHQGEDQHILIECLQHMEFQIQSPPTADHHI